MRQDPTTDDFRVRMIRACHVAAGDRAALARELAILDAMSDDERACPERIGATARSRIAALACVDPAAVVRLLDLLARTRAGPRRAERGSSWRWAKRALGLDGRDL